MFVGPVGCASEKERRKEKEAPLAIGTKLAASDSDLVAEASASRDQIVARGSPVRGKRKKKKKRNIPLLRAAKHKQLEYM